MEMLSSCDRGGEEEDEARMLVSMKEMMDPPCSSFMLLCWDMMNWSIACITSTASSLSEEEVLFLFRRDEVLLVAFGGEEAMMPASSRIFHA